MPGKLLNVKGYLFWCFLFFVFFFSSHKYKIGSSTNSKVVRGREVSGWMGLHPHINKQFSGQSLDILKFNSILTLPEDHVSLHRLRGQLYKTATCLPSLGPQLQMSVASPHCYLCFLIWSRAMCCSWAQSLHVFSISLITRSRLHSASMTFPEFQGLVQTVVN